MAAAAKVYVYPNGATMLPYAPPSAEGYYIGRASSGLTMPSHTTISVYDESTDTLLGTFGFSYSGYTFKEWNTSPDGTGTSYNVGDSVTGTGTKNFYAIWEAEAIDIAISYKGSTIATLSASGTKTLETEGKYCEDDITVTYTKPAAPTPSLQTKSATYTPTTSQQTASITADAGYDGLDEVNITVNAMPSGSAGTPTATKGTVSGNSVSVTPSVTNTTGYITGGTKTGTAVTVSASELVSGTKTISASGTTDVTNYASASVAAGSASTPATTITANPTISVSSGGLITASVSGSQSVTPTVSAGYVSSGTAGTVTVSGSNTQQLSVYAGAHHQPTPSNYSVTVSLTNPVHSSNFNSCTIYEALSNDPYDTGNLLGSISTATGSETVQVPPTVYGIIVIASGSEVYIPTNGIFTTGGVSLSQDIYDIVVFSVTADGTATLSSIDYNS